MSPPQSPAYGADPSRYQFIPRVLVIATYGDHVLLVRRSEHKKLWPGKYNAPGGHVERGEDPYAAALRELSEETGVEVGSLRLRGLIVAETGLRGSGILVFVYQGQALAAALHPSEEGEPAWVRRSEWGALDLVSDLPQVLELVLDQPSFFYLYKVPDAGGEQVHVRVVEDG